MAANFAFSCLVAQLLFPYAKYISWVLNTRLFLTFFPSLLFFPSTESTVFFQFFILCRALLFRDRRHLTSA